MMMIIIIIIIIHHHHTTSPQNYTFTKMFGKCSTKVKKTHGTEFKSIHIFSNNQKLL